MAAAKAFGEAALITIPRSEYERLLAKAGELPSLPEPDEQGNYPAREAIAVSLARDLILQRRALGLSQAALARRAGIRPETINRLEQGKHAPNLVTVDKIERALARAKVEAGSRRARREER